MNDYAQIWYDGFKMALPRAEHKGCNLRAFFAVAKDRDLFVECDDGDDVLIEDNNTPYFVDHRDKFYSVHRKINGS